MNCSSTRVKIKKLSILFIITTILFFCIGALLPILFIPGLLIGVFLLTIDWSNKGK